MVKQAVIEFRLFVFCEWCKWSTWKRYKTIQQAKQALEVLHRNKQEHEEFRMKE